jgi:hypothetical protein
MKGARTPLPEGEVETAAAVRVRGCALSGKGSPLTRFAPPARLDLSLRER